MNPELDDTIVDAEIVPQRALAELAVREMEQDLVVYQMVTAEAGKGGRFDWRWWWQSLPVAIRSGDVDTFRHLIGMGLKNGLA
jgi:hypothetical protein